MKGSSMMRTISSSRALERKNWRRRMKVSRHDKKFRGSSKNSAVLSLCTFKRTKYKGMSLVVVVLLCAIMQLNFSHHSLSLEFPTEVEMRLFSHFTNYNKTNVSKKKETPPPRSLARFVLEFIQKNNKRQHYGNGIFSGSDLARCENDTSLAILEEWKSNYEQLVCEFGHGQSEVRVDRHVLSRWDMQPTIHRYKNVQALSKNGPPLLDSKAQDHRCSKIGERENSVFSQVESPSINHTASKIFEYDVNTTLIRIVLFDPFNAYERFHAYINVALVMMMFDIDDPQLVFVGPNAKNQTDEGDQQFWRLFSRLPPTIASNDTGATHVHAPYRYRFREIIDAQGAALSMLNTKTRSFDGMRSGGLRGRGSDHHCESLLFRGILAWFHYKARLHSQREKEQVSKSIVDSSSGTNRNKMSIQRRVLWSSRQPYCCRFGKVWSPKRILRNETEFLQALSDRLGPNFSIESVDFGSISPYESIRLASSFDIMVGIHGAGLVWSAFLSLGQTKDTNTSTIGGLVEIFGGNRSPTNRHYHNLASLSGIPYRETKHWSGKSSLGWDTTRVDEVAALIRSLE